MINGENEWEPGLVDYSINNTLCVRVGGEGQEVAALKIFCGYGRFRFTMFFNPYAFILHIFLECFKYKRISFIIIHDYRG